MKPIDDQTLIRVFDANGRELLITKEEWCQKVLPSELKRRWNDLDARLFRLNRMDLSETLKQFEDALKALSSA